MEPVQRSTILEYQSYQAHQIDGSKVQLREHSINYLLYFLYSIKLFGYFGYFEYFGYLDILDIRTIKPTLTQGGEIGDTSAEIITNNSLPDKIHKKFIHKFTDIKSVVNQTAQ